MATAAVDEGAAPKELLIEACRRDNTSLLHEVFSEPPLQSSAPAIAHFLNTATDPLGASALHVAAANGSYEILDIILDQEGVEIDGIEPRDGDTCLHRAVRHANSLDRAEWPHGAEIVDILLDAGCDPRIRNKAKLKPFDLADPRNTELRTVLQKAEITAQATADATDTVAEDDDDDVNGAGSESD